MKPAPFEYLAPETLPDALAALDAHNGVAKILAGGQSLIPTMNFRLTQPEVLIDINNLTELDYISAEPNGTLRIGAMTRQETLARDPLIKEHLPLLHETMPLIAHAQIRNRGTIGGSLVHADPAAELPALMCLLQARLKLVSSEGERWCAAGDFYQGMFSIDMQENELLTEITIPAMPNGCGYAIREVARRHGDYALAGVAVIVELDRKQRCSACRIAMLSVGDRPILAEKAAESLRGKQLDQNALEAAAQIAGDEIDPGDDIHASADYRRHLARVLTVETLGIAFERART